MILCYTTLPMPQADVNTNGTISDKEFCEQVNMYIYIYIYTQTHVYIYIYIYIYTHIQVRSGNDSVNLSDSLFADFSPTGCQFQLPLSPSLSLPLSCPRFYASTCMYPVWGLTMPNVLILVGSRCLLGESDNMPRIWALRLRGY